MFSKTKPFPLTVLLLGIALIAACGPPAESQSLRERIKARAAQRQTIVQPAQAADGVRSMSLVHDGITRNFLVYAPAGVSARPGAVFVFHGGGGSAARTADSNPTRDAADRGGFLAVYPDAIDGNWTDGRIGTASGPDDVGFVRAVVAALQQEYGLDPARVFGTGISNGGIFTHKLACSAPGVMRAIAPVAANMSESLAAVCNPGRGTPVMMFSGTDDPLMPFKGGKPELADVIARKRGPATDVMISAPDTVALWARINGCGGSSSQELGAGANDGTTVTRISYEGCSAAPVTLFRVNGGGHTWPGSSGRSPNVAGTVSKDISATSEMIRFFQGFGL